jgi:alpha-tubulin suppressor-like RCC1 family protein
MRSRPTRFTTWLLVAVLLGSAACQGDQATGPSPDFATAAASVSYEWISAGGYHGCVSRAPLGTSNWTLLCWGENPGAFTWRTTPGAVANNTGSFFALGEGGNSHHCELSNSRAYCWGQNTYGQLGDGTTTTRSAPTLVSGGITWRQISGGLYHTCGVNDIGVAFCWGQGTEGELGHGGTTNKLVPTPVSTAIAFWSVYAGNHFTCGRTRTSPSAIYCWGRNSSGQLGIGSTTRLLKPGAAVTGGAKWSWVAVGHSHVCAVTYPGVSGAPNYCWGSNGNGQLGIGVTGNRSSPVAVSGNQRVSPIVAGDNFTCGALHTLPNTGQMVCWGRGNLGQLGNGFFVDRLTPYPVYGGHTYTGNTTRIAAGRDFMVVLRSDNAVVTWGYNNLGQLGDGTTNTRGSPVVILPP